MVSNIFCFYAYLGRWSNLTCAYFSNGLVQPPTRYTIVSPPKTGKKPKGTTSMPCHPCVGLKVQSLMELEKWATLVSGDVCLEGCLCIFFVVGFVGVLKFKSHGDVFCCVLFCLVWVCFCCCFVCLVWFDLFGCRVFVFVFERSML